VSGDRIKPPRLQAVPLRRNRDFTLLWAGEATSMLGSQMSGVAFPLLVLAITGSAFKAGLVGTAQILPMAALSLPAGVLVDRVDRKRVMVICNVMGSLALVTVAGATWAGVITFEQILIVALVVGTAFTFFRIAEAGVIAQLVPREQLPDAVSQNVARQYMAGLVGPAVGGLVFATSRALPFLLDAVSYTCSLGAVLLVKGRFQEDRVGGQVSIRSDLSEGLRWLWQRPFLRNSLLLVAGSNFVPTYLLLIVVARDRGASPTVVGVMLSLFSVGGLLGALASPRLQRLVPVPIVVLGFVWLGAAVFLMLAFTPEPLAMGALAAVWAFFGPLWDSAVVGYRLAATPDRLQGRVTSVDWMLSTSLATIGPAVAGYLLSTVGGRTTLLVFSGFLALSALVGTATPSLRTSPPEIDATSAITPTPV
jgi:MFS family permease